jgi:hypothetical protein
MPLCTPTIITRAELAELEERQRVSPYQVWRRISREP